MKAYKCDICKEFCEDVFTIGGIQKPITHEKIEGLVKGEAECCPQCYDLIMGQIMRAMNRKEKPGGDKSLFVFDTPKNCASCKLWHMDDSGAVHDGSYCVAADVEIDLEAAEAGINSCCPREKSAILIRL